MENGPGASFRKNYSYVSGDWDRASRSCPTPAKPPTDRSVSVGSQSSGLAAAAPAHREAAEMSSRAASPLDRKVFQSPLVAGPTVTTAAVPCYAWHLVVPFQVPSAARIAGVCPIAWLAAVTWRSSLLK